MVKGAGGGGGITTLLGPSAVTGGGLAASIAAPKVMACWMPAVGFLWPLSCISKSTALRSTPSVVV
eukprot:5007796-Alexandrium_andersonii.AAC.1